jgi:4-amino-4-deoxy-L-arabinose transferase-like glycosyltransferase
MQQGRIRIESLILLGLLICGLLSLENHVLPLIDRDEPRFAEASREMLQSGDWCIPRFDQAPRYDKPPLIYWMQCAAYRALGENEFAARLPAVICTALTAVVIAIWGASISDPATGLRAACIFVLCLQVFVHGRAAVADPPMVLFSTLAAWVGWRWLQNRSMVAAALLWVFAAVGFLAKGPVAWIPLGMTLHGAFRQRRNGTPMPSALRVAAGCIFMLLIVGLWGIPALIRTGGEFASIGLGKHVVARSLVSMEGHGARNALGYLLTLPFYFGTVFLSFAPWSIWLPRAIKAHFKNQTHAGMYLLSGVIMTFGIFTISRTKLPHYTLPAFPFLALLLALWWREAGSVKVWNRTAVGCCLLFGLIPFTVFPLAKKLSATESLAIQLRTAGVCAKETALVDYREPSMIWMLRGMGFPFPTTLQEEEVARWLSESDSRLCILSTEAAKNLTGHPRIEAQGWNFAKGRRVTLAAVGPAAAGSAKSPSIPVK